MSQSSWLHTARNVHLQGKSTLAAELQKRDGSWHHATIDLNNYLGNSDGKFLWNGTNFAATARDTKIEDRRPQSFEAWILATLQEADGVWPQGTDSAGLNITDALKNEDGNFVCGMAYMEIEEEYEFSVTEDYRNWE
ncbi:CNVH-domain-containing protein [Terfezia boudieri ATCC MYA-4762]|uniref:CNVH-domain-containing protein n=1 Tax=Terfezia boudieri ATCC MYA-4762 TaxID=1051890 RepID=A0A3N4LJ34_9PEZI|nr:CNVH-domain-containing protein [Terfezia boudieri ATCC MYA-4762]